MLPGVGGRSVCALPHHLDFITTQANHRRYIPVLSVSSTFILIHPINVHNFHAEMPHVNFTFTR